MIAATFQPFRAVYQTLNSSDLTIKSDKCELAAVPTPTSRRTFQLAFFGLAAWSVGSGHPGKTDAKGGHRDAKTGTYHSHRGQPSKTTRPSAGTTKQSPTAPRSATPASVGHPLQRGAIVLNVAAEQVVRSESQWQTAWGDFSKDYINARVLVIDLRQLGPGNPQVKVEWFFIGRDHDKKHLFIYDSGETTGSIARGGIKLTPSSRELVSNRSSYRNGRLTGQRPWGWSVFVTQNGRALGETASLPELVKWTQEHRGAARKPSPTSRKPVRFVPQALGAARR